MRIQAFLILVALGFATPGFAGKKLRVLFLGNSYTYYNNMPQMIADMATSTGDTLDWDMVAPGGYTLGNHAANSTSVNKIIAGGWDYLVLQEQSQLPAVIGFTTGLADLRYLFRTNNPCGRMMLYMTWGRKNGDAFNCPTYPHVCTYPGMDSALRDAYIKAASDYKGELSPVGAAWRYVRTNNPGINLYDPDESHPSLAGSYLAAGSFYTAFFKKNPAAISYNATLGATTANALKQAAKAVVFDSLSHWDFTPTVPAAGFSYTIGAGFNQVLFVNGSANADSYLWDFGDGNTSTALHPVHSYANDGTYTVKLTAYNCDIDTVYKSTYQSTVSFCPFTPTITPSKITLCPGVTDSLWTQVYDTYQWYDELHDPVPGGTGQYLPVSTYNRYYVKATLNGCWELSEPATVFTAGSFSPWYLLADGKLVGQDTACAGDTIVLMVKFNKPPLADDSLIDWKINGQPVTGHHNDTLYITKTGIYEATVRHELCPSLYKTDQLSFSFINCPTGIDEVEQVSFTVAPNPATDVVYISSPAFATGGYTIHLTDQFGRMVYRSGSNASVQQYMNLSPYASGIYFIAIVQNGNAVYRGKVVKQ